MRNICDNGGSILTAQSFSRSIDMQVAIVKAACVDWKIQERFLRDILMEFCDMI